jgi:hypothetical protein
MSLNNNIRKKAFGIMNSIESMNQNERGQRPSESFGINYNKLRTLSLDNNKELDQLMPPEVSFRDVFSETFTEHNFSEIHTFCSEIYHLLEPDD